MKTKRYRRGRGKKYVTRVFLLIVLAGIAFSVTFGCLFLLDRFNGIEAAAASVQQVSIEEEKGPQNVIDPKPEPTPVAAQIPAGMYVVLDAGHGGNDGGTYYKDVIEKNVNLEVTMLLEDILEENGVQVIMTRTEDVYLGLDERCVIANGIVNADLFVSIHCNYYEDSTSVDGMDCYYCPGKEDGQQLAETMAGVLRENDKLEVRGVKAEDFYVLEHTDMTAVLVEIGFLSNPTDRANLQDESYQEMLAEALAKGILLHLQQTGAAEN